MWDYYATEEHLGLERFEDSLTQHSEFSKDIAPPSKDLKELTHLIDTTNRKLQMSFKREHKYNLKIYEEQLYKEVMFDARPDLDQTEETRWNNTLKKAKASGATRNVSKQYDEIKDIVPWPSHKKIPHKI